jgi:hypothetical protein
LRISNNSHSFCHNSENISSRWQNFCKFSRFSCFLLNAILRVSHGNFKTLFRFVNLIIQQCKLCRKIEICSTCKKWVFLSERKMNFQWKQFCD